MLQINEFRARQPETCDQAAMSVEEVALGFVRVANEAMCRPIRALTQVRTFGSHRPLIKSITPPPQKKKYPF